MLSFRFFLFLFFLCEALAVGLKVEMLPMAPCCFTAFFLFQVVVIVVFYVVVGHCLNNS